MKTIQNTTSKQIDRVSDEKADELVSNGEWKFVSKSVWKENIRDVK